MAKHKPQKYSSGIGETPTQQEGRVASKIIKGRRQPGSGSSDYAKGDIEQRTGTAFDNLAFLIESKQTVKKSLSIKGEWLAKISKEAWAAGKEPALEFEIHGVQDPLLELEWIAVPLSVFNRLQRAARGEEY